MFHSYDVEFSMSEVQPDDLGLPHGNLQAKEATIDLTDISHPLENLYYKSVYFVSRLHVCSMCTRWQRGHQDQRSTRGGWSPQTRDILLFRENSRLILVVKAD